MASYQLIMDNYSNRKIPYRYQFGSLSFIISCASPALMRWGLLTKEGGIKYYYHHEKCYFVERSIATYSHCISAYNIKKMCTIKRVSLIYAIKPMNYMVYYCKYSNSYIGNFKCVINFFEYKIFRFDSNIYYKPSYQK